MLTFPPKMNFETHQSSKMSDTTAVSHAICQFNFAQKNSCVALDATLNTTCEHATTEFNTN